MERCEMREKWSTQARVQNTRAGDVYTDPGQVVRARRHDKTLRAEPEREGGVPAENIRGDPAEHDRRA